jgi:hypothetical protein
MMASWYQRLPAKMMAFHGILWHFMAFHGIVHGIPNMVIEFFRVECRFHGNSMVT